MIDGIIRKIDLENVPTAEIKKRESLHTDMNKQQYADTEDIKKDENLKEAIDRIVSVAKFFNRRLRLEVEQDLNIILVKVVDSETKEVVRQIPPEELVELSKNARDLKGLLIDKEG